MQQIEFDGFGERLPESHLPPIPQDRASRWVTRAGVGLFWSLVVVIVTARALYFVPAFAGNFEKLAAIPHLIRTIFGT